ncbi:MAG: hypothetical protein IPL61_12655 [Myxococcales bacterium]|nr:hypothetical protein [Myxococcales bacterium]
MPEIVPAATASITTWRSAVAGLSSVSRAGGEGQVALGRGRGDREAADEALGAGIGVDDRHRGREVGDDGERRDAERVGGGDVEHDRAAGEDLADGGRGPGDDRAGGVEGLGRIGAEQLAGVLLQVRDPGQDVGAIEPGREAVGGAQPRQHRGAGARAQGVGLDHAQGEAAGPALRRAARGQLAVRSELEHRAAGAADAVERGLGRAGVVGEPIHQRAGVERDRGQALLGGDGGRKAGEAAQEHRELDRLGQRGRRGQRRGHERQRIGLEVLGDQGVGPRHRGGEVGLARGGEPRQADGGDQLGRRADRDRALLGRDEPEHRRAQLGARVEGQLGAGVPGLAAASAQDEVAERLLDRAVERAAIVGRGLADQRADLARVPAQHRDLSAADRLRQPDRAGDVPELRGRRPAVVGAGHGGEREERERAAGEARGRRRRRAIRGHGQPRVVPELSASASNGCAGSHAEGTTSGGAAVPLARPRRESPKKGKSTTSKRCRTDRVHQTRWIAAVRCRHQGVSRHPGPSRPDLAQAPRRAQDLCDSVRFGDTCLSA